MIPKSILENYRLRLRQDNPNPSIWLGDFADSYVRDFKGLSDDEKIRHLCGLMETLFEIGINIGKEISVDAIKQIIMRHR